MLVCFSAAARSGSTGMCLPGFDIRKEVAIGRQETPGTGGMGCPQGLMPLGENAVLVDHASNSVMIGYSFILSTPSRVLNLFRMTFSMSLKLVPFMSSTMLNVPWV